MIPKFQLREVVPCLCKKATEMFILNLPDLFVPCTKKETQNVTNV